MGGADGRTVGRRFGGKESQLAALDVILLRIEQLDDAGLPIIPGHRLDLPHPHPPDAFRQPHATHRLDLRQRNILQNRQFRSQFGQQQVEILLHGFGVGANVVDFPQHLRQRHQTGKGVRAGRRSHHPVSQDLHPVQHADRHRLAAHSAQPVVGDGLRRFPIDLAFAMAVVMVLALFGEKFNRALENSGITRLEGLEDGWIRQVGVENGRFAGQLGGRVGVGVGDEGIAVQGRDAPIHRRIGGEAGFQGKDVGRQILETFFDRIVAGFGAKQGKPGRPDVGRDKVAGRIDLQDDF